MDYWLDLAHDESVSSVARLYKLIPTATDAQAAMATESLILCHMVLPPQSAPAQALNFGRPGCPAGHPVSQPGEHSSAPNQRPHSHASNLRPLQYSQPLGSGAPTHRVRFRFDSPKVEYSSTHVAPDHCVPLATRLPLSIHQLAIIRWHLNHPHVGGQDQSSNPFGPESLAADNPFASDIPLAASSQRRVSTFSQLGRHAPAPATYRLSIL